MVEYLTGTFVLLTLAAPVAIFVLQAQRVRGGTQSWGRATLWFAMLAVCPVIAYGLLVLGLIGLEEVTGAAIVAEGIARTFIFVLIIGFSEVILLSLVFFVTSYLIRQRQLD